jgi:FlgD Ig-like domain
MQHSNKTFHHGLFAVIAATMIGVLLTPFAYAQQSAIDRPYQPVVLNGSAFPQFSNNTALLNQLFLYKYTGATNTWEQIPFQFDEVEPDSLDSTKTTYFLPGDGKLDDLDELAFMVRDAGDQAPAGVWINDTSSRSSARYEIRLTDPLSIGSASYVYLYRSATLTINPNLTDYVTYVPPQGQPGNDVIKAVGYEEGHQANGIHNSLLVPASAGGTGTNFLDRLKLRFQIQIFVNIPITEDDFIFLGINVQDGRVRVIRELRERISLAGNNIDFPLLILYYGYSTELGTGVNLTDLPVPVNLLRQSFDFAPSVSGAKWYNQNVTTAVTVDGTPDNLSTDDLKVVNLPDLNWYMLSSAQGSFINIFSLPKDLGTTQKFYYYDAPNGVNDGTKDTGSNGSWGDSGFLATAANITGNFALSLTSYILGKDQPRDVGETLRNQTLQPLQTNVQSQSFTTGVTEADSPTPQHFVLLQNSPNPVSPATVTTIRYELPFSGNATVSLRIFNLLGQSVRELVNAAQPAGRYEVRWDGRLENGALAPAGIYFYQLRTGQQTITQKLMMLP